LAINGRCRRQWSREPVQAGVSAHYRPAQGLCCRARHEDAGPGCAGGARPVCGMFRSVQASLPSGSRALGYR